MSTHGSCPTHALAPVPEATMAAKRGRYDVGAMDTEDDIDPALVIDLNVEDIPAICALPSSPVKLGATAADTLRNFKLWLDKSVLEWCCSSKARVCLTSGGAAVGKYHRLTGGELLDIRQYFLSLQTWSTEIGASNLSAGRWFEILPEGSGKRNVKMSHQLIGPFL